MTIPASLIITCLSFASGALTGGYLANKFWVSERNKSVVEELEQKLETSNLALDLQRQNVRASQEINEKYKEAVSTLQDVNDTISEANAKLANSRASRTDTIYREGKAFTDEIQDYDSCAKQPVDPRLLDHIWPRGNSGN